MSSSTAIIMRRRSRQERQRAARARRIFWWAFFGVVFVLAVVVPMGGAVVGAAAMYLTATADLPTPQMSLAALTAEGVTRFYDRQNVRLLYSVEDPLGRDREWLTLDGLPAYVSQAMLAAEDPDFLDATVFNPLGAAGDLWINALIATSAPDMTLTGRLVRNLLNPTPEGETARNLARQREIALVSEINRRYTPEQVLEWHLNTEYYGHEAYGIEAAAQIYLGKRAAELTLGEAALLAAIPNAPQYNPFDDETAARARGQDALRGLLASGAIDEAQLNQAAAETITFRDQGFVAQLAPDFMEYARRQAETILNDLGYDGRQLVERGGLTITTTLDIDLNLQAECALRAQMARLGGGTAGDAADGSPCIGSAFLPELDSAAASTPPNEGSVVVLDARTGEIRALVGGATDAAFQPGLTLQPFVYLDSFVNPRRLTSPATMALDIPQSFPGAEEGLIYSPSNPDGRSYGVMNLRSAMSAALASPAAATAFQQGMGSVLRTAHQIGVSSLGDEAYDVMLLERGGRAAPLDLAYAYSVFATLGDMRGVPVEPIGPGYRARDPVAVREIRDRDGALLWSYDADAAAACDTLDTCTPLLEDALAYLVNDVYADTSPRWQTVGQGSPLELSRPAAIVSGPASDGAENWAIGYTPQLVTAVQLDRADGAAMDLSPWMPEGAAAVWHAVMEYAHTRDALPVENWDRPPLVVEMPVCERSGLLPNGVCPTYREVFRDGMQPRTTDTYWQVADVNDRTGQLATVNTPPELIAQRTYFVPPEDARVWWQENNLPLPPVEYDTVSVPDLFTSVRLTAPEAFSYVGGLVSIAGEMDDAGLQYYQLSYGEGLNPSRWIDIGGQQTTYTPGQPLATWDTTGLDGLYSLRLVLTRTDNTFESDALQVTVDNVPPTVTLDSVEPGRIYRFPGDTEVTLEASAADNIAIDRVEFYADGQPLGADESWPYQLNWDIDGPGTFVFSAVVYDAVGNSAQADLTVEILRAG